MIPSPTKKLFLIDGYNLVYRSCLTSGPRLTGPTGEPTTGTLFFTKSILKICNQKPDYLVFCLDSPRKTLFRRELDSNYKSKRSQPSEDLVVQVGRCIQISRALQIPVIRVEGFEADDIMATLAFRHQNETECTIFSSDKDLHQLVTDKVSIMDLMKELRITPREVEEKWGVPPDKVVEIQTLSGDAVDNVKGVEGVGAKRALDLVLKYGSADEAKRNSGELTPKLKESLDKANLDVLKQLVKLRTDVPIEEPLESLQFGGLKDFSQELKDLFKLLGFNRWAT